MTSTGSLLRRCGKNVRLAGIQHYTYIKSTTGS